ncbi:uncharacterized protein BO97DRAFT_425449 [Aspergillus homomorphus CBS 101889]|uniref:Dickkopf N-terminal cysteine-rich domain-containing protein n=1 Tax=Aspergillus homomorphus (strain CBS 101889) TaxID=1450537 RepID=A0A395HU19_ASPHC|nr:hypothetical protein BO97DRAFT_425449 [Aspergillus homomorphus CBS 101889]RAL11452.1 hypothetical protein BO97DRAFT_425449 [Aspergillus homomorphus CBS 101889]
MSRLSTSIVSAVAILMVVGGTAASVVPQAQTQDFIVACPGVHCGSESYRSQPILARGEEEAFVDVTDDELDSSADSDATADTCYNRSQCEVGFTCLNSRCTLSCISDSDCSRLHTCTNGTCMDPRGGACLSNRNRCTHDYQCCSGRCDRFAAVFGSKKCRSSIKIFP